MNRDSNAEQHILRLKEYIQDAKKNPNKSTLNLSWCHVTDSDILDYIAAEIGNPQFKSIKLNFNKISDKGAEKESRPNRRYYASIQSLIKRNHSLYRGKSL